MAQNLERPQATPEKSKVTRLAEGKVNRAQAGDSAFPGSPDTHHGLRVCWGILATLLQGKLSPEHALARWHSERGTHLARLRIVFQGILWAYLHTGLPGSTLPRGGPMSRLGSTLGLRAFPGLKFCVIILK